MIHRVLSLLERALASPMVQTFCFGIAVMAVFRALDIGFFEFFCALVAWVGVTYRIEVIEKAQGTEAQRAATTGAVEDDGPAPKGCAQNKSGGG